MKYWLWGCWLMVSVWCQAQEVNSAVCVIQNQGKLLMVQDRVSGRFGLSGGYIEPGETPAEAALRELHEETGLTAEIVRPLGRLRNSEAFVCRSRTPIAATPAGIVDLLSAPNLGGEILQARLITPEAPEAPQRFADQLPWLQHKLQPQDDSPIQLHDNFIAQASLLHRAELPWIGRIQQWSEPLAPLLTIANLFGEQTLYMLLLPLLLPLLGWQKVRELLFAFGTLTLLITLAKIAVGWPRPFHFNPQLADLASSGFGMPSGHTATAMLFWGWLLLEWPRCRQPLLWATLAAFLTGWARVQLGVHFLSDVLVGGVIGALLLRLRPWLIRAGTNLRWWWGLSAVSLLFAWLTQSPNLAALTSLGVGLALGQALPLVRHSRKPVQTTLLALLGSIACALLQWQLPALMIGSLPILLLQWSAMALLGLWLAAGIWWIASLPVTGADDERQQA